jgi:hypothetical protein
MTELLDLKLHANGDLKHWHKASFGKLIVRMDA